MEANDTNPAKQRTETLAEFNARRAKENEEYGFRPVAGRFTLKQLKALAERCLFNLGGEEPTYTCPVCLDTGFVARDMGPTDEYVEIERGRRDGEAFENPGGRRKPCMVYGSGQGLVTVSSRCRCKETVYGNLKPYEGTQEEMP